MPPLLQVCPQAFVEINGLRSKSELNGRRGTVLAFIEESSRWSVRLENEDGTEANKTLAVKSENLTLKFPEFETTFLSRILPESAHASLMPPDFMSEAVAAFLHEEKRRHWPTGMRPEDRDRACQLLWNGFMAASTLRWKRTLTQQHQAGSADNYGRAMHDGTLNLGDVMVSGVCGHDFETFTTNFSNAPPNKVQMTFGTCHVAVGFNDLRVLLDANFIDSSGILSFVGIDLNAYCVAKSLVIVEMLRASNVPLKHLCQVWYSSTWTDAALVSFREAATAASLKPNVDMHVQDLLEFWRTAKPLPLMSARDRWMYFFESEERKWDTSWLANLLREKDRIAAAMYYVTGELHTDGDMAEVSSVTMWSLPKAWPPVKNADSIFATMRLEDVIKNLSFVRSQEHIDICAAFASDIIAKLEVVRGLLQESRLEIDLWCEEVSLENVDVLQKIIAKDAQTMSWSNIVDYMTADDFHKLAQACSSDVSWTLHHVYSMEWVKEVYGVCLCDWSRRGRQRARASILKSLEVGEMKRMAKSFANSAGIGHILELPGFHCPSRFWTYLMAVHYHDKWVAGFIGDRPSVTGVSFDMLLPLILHRRFPTTIYVQWSYGPSQGGQQSSGSIVMNTFDAAFRTEIAQLIR